MAKPGPTSRFEKLDYKDELRAKLMDPRWTYARTRKWLIKEKANPIPKRTLEYWKGQIKRGVEGYVKEPYRPEDPRSDEYIYYIKLKRLVDNLEKEIKECDNFNKRMKLQKFYRDTLKDIYTLFKTYGNTTPEEAVADMEPDDRLKGADDIRDLVSDGDSFQSVEDSGVRETDDTGEEDSEPEGDPDPGDPREILGDDDPTPDWDESYVTGEGKVTEEELEEIEAEERESSEPEEPGDEGPEEAGGLQWYERGILEDQLERIPSDFLRDEVEALTKTKEQAEKLESMLLGVVDELEIQNKAMDYIEDIQPGYEFPEKFKVQEEDAGESGDAEEVEEPISSEGPDKKRLDTDKASEEAGVNDETEQSSESDKEEPSGRDSEDEGVDPDKDSCICMKSQNQGKIIPNPDCPIHGELA
jgi:hypothetical protein